MAESITSLIELKARQDALLDAQKPVQIFEKRSLNHGTFFDFFF